MNKLMGFFELKDMSLPTIPWKEYTGSESMKKELLWTIRSAVFRGNDLNLPRLVGATSEEAKEFADQLLGRIRHNGIVIYYPYFVAEKSGTLEVKKDEVVIEAVESDLWNMVTLSDRNVTIRYMGDEEIIDGDEAFLSDTEKQSLLSHVKEIKRQFRGDILEGKSILLEWSFAKNCDLNKTPIGEEYLVFYEARTV